MLVSVEEVQLFISLVWTPSLAGWRGLISGMSFSENGSFQNYQAISLMSIHLAHDIMHFDASYPIYNYSRLRHKAPKPISLAPPLTLDFYLVPLILCRALHLHGLTRRTLMSAYYLNRKDAGPHMHVKNISCTPGTGRTMALSKPYSYQSHFLISLQFHLILMQGFPPEKEAAAVSWSIKRRKQKS